ncbi:MAG: NADH-quinone oxidoreductase subunit [Solirubrobacteraceae bacterium]|jgi:NADH-quinone oxidoreductase subunit L|nr:NADH-quinone oxidoreductase subunit [Solirubrobacteraceae bacterium]
MSTTTFGWLILLFPLLGCVVVALGFRVERGISAGVIGSAAIALSFAASVGALISILGRADSSRELTSSLWNYASTVGVDAKLSILVDPLSIFMALIVSGVSTLIHIYSIAYMKSDRGYVRFFSYLNFFVFSMLLLVMAGNFLLLIVGWAFVGAASYLLISFWYRRTTATRAGLKAFVINVVGDVGLVLGTFFIFRHTGTLDFLKTFHAVPHVFGHNATDLVAGCLLLLVGAAAKSAQVPLHTWLPDAMEGPTPVSALIHAATMVTAGVYLIARMHPLFEVATTAADVGAIMGCATLLIAATIAIVQTDLKRVIAYSTMSQIGYMVMGVSVGAYSAGLFHLMTHAFFKALLFMAAGSLISAMGGEQSLDRMRGFRRAMPFTFICFVVGGLALSGLPPFSGWLSKDDIIAYLDHRGGGFEILGILGYVGALMTGIYTFRMIFRAFFGEPCEEARDLAQGHLYHPESGFNPGTGELEDADVGFPGPEHHIAERDLAMKVPMAVLGVLAVVGGVLQIPGVDAGINRFLEPSFAGSRLAQLDPSTSSAWIGLIIGGLIGLAGIGIAYRIWIVAPGTSARLQTRFGALQTFFYNKWYFDELIDFAVVRPSQWLGGFTESVLERGVIAGGVTGGTLGVVRAFSATVRRLQTGFLRYYAAAMLIGVFGMALYFLISA